MPEPEPPEVVELERAAAWRMRLVDADPSDHVSAVAAERLEGLAATLRQETHDALWGELRAIGNWLGESGAISDYAELAAAYRARIGVSEMPESGADYLRSLLEIARGLMYR